MRRSSLFYITCCIVAALMPVVFVDADHSTTGATAVVFPGWPMTFEGKTLTEVPLTQLEGRFATDFPGRIGRFTDGEREIIIRWVTEATRKMHPASDCFQGLGYSVKPLPVRRDENGYLWASFAATKGEERLRVYERIHNDSGETWSDVSSWYWSALRHNGAGSWWAITVAEKER